MASPSQIATNHIGSTRELNASKVSPQQLLQVSWLANAKLLHAALSRDRITLADVTSYL